MKPHQFLGPRRSHVDVPGHRHGRSVGGALLGEAQAGEGNNCLPCEARR